MLHEFQETSSPSFMSWDFICRILGRMSVVLKSPPITSILLKASDPFVSNADMLSMRSAVSLGMVINTHECVPLTFNLNINPSIISVLTRTLQIFVFFIDYNGNTSAS